MLGFEAVDGQGLALAAPGQGQALIRRSKRLGTGIRHPRTRKWIRGAAMVAATRVAAVMKNCVMTS
eukprot:461575-Prymnesium_polylepis.1